MSNVEQQSSPARETIEDEPKRDSEQRRRFTYVHQSNEPRTPPATQTSSSNAVNQNNFKFLKHIGEGSFSEVYGCIEIATGRHVAIKCCEKLKIKQERKVEYIMREKEIMSQIKHPLFVQLYYTFQDQTRLYFVMTLAPHGELLNVLKRVGAFDAEACRFYTAEVVLALEYLHYELGVIHRDLKPENILLSETNHIMLSDFGSAKILKADEKKCLLDPSSVEEFVSESLKHPKPQRPMKSSDSDDDTSTKLQYSHSERRSSFVGTAQYVSPEVLNGQRVTFASDYWALGCIIYQMVAGLPPFRDVSEYQIFKRICAGDFSFPCGFPDKARDLVSKLIVVDWRRRLGAVQTGGVESLKSHTFFNGLQWNDLLAQQPPPIRPYLPASGDEPALWSQMKAPFGEASYDHLPAGLDSQLGRLHGIDGAELLDLALPKATRRSAELDNVIPITPKSSSANLHPHGQARSKSATSSKESAGTSPSSTMAANLREALMAVSTSRSSTIMNYSKEDRQRRIKQQRESNPYHRYVNENLILKQGFCEKKVGLFARNRMFLLTEGPHLYYIDVGNNELKGEVPMSLDMRTEAANFKTFFIHTPGRTYYLMDKERGSQAWCEAIEEVRDYYFKKGSRENNGVADDSD